MTDRGASRKPRPRLDPEAVLAKRSRLLLSAPMPPSSPPTYSDGTPFKLPINLGLNDGTYCSPKVLDVLAGVKNNAALRNYSTNDNKPLLEIIAAECRCKPENIFLHNGSGPILKQAIPEIIRQAIKSSPIRVMKHLLTKNGYPIITPSLTYGKVPLKAMNSGLQVRLVPLRAEENFKLNLGLLTAAIDQGDGLVYLANPNNPTGNVLITRDELEPLLVKYPGTTFWIDEAYVQYISPERHKRVADLVTTYPNLFVLRTMSFAYGLAAVRVGYLLGRAELIKTLESQLTDYRIPALTEQIALAALSDEQHLAWVRDASATAREVITQGLSKHAWLQVYPSEANFLLVRITDGKRKAKPIAAALLERGIKIKTFTNLPGYNFEDLFRVTIGLPEENRFFVEMFDDAVASGV